MKKITITILVLILISLVFIYINIDKNIQIKNNNEAYDNINKILTTKLNEQKDNIMSLAIALSNNPQIQTALLNDDEDMGYEILSQNLKSLKQYLKWDDIYTQVLTRDLFIFARSWDSTFSGMPLENFRDDLKEVVDKQKPKVEISIGRLISLKASIPISYDDELLGTLEVISLLDNIVEELRAYDIEIIPLMDIDFIDQAYFMDQNPIVDNQFIVANKNFNKNILFKLQNLPSNSMKKLLKNDLLIIDDKLFAKYPMVNGKGEVLGIYVAIVPMDDISKYFIEDESIFNNIIQLNSTQKDIFEYIKYKDENIFMNIDQGYIANFKDILTTNEDKEEFEQVARMKLQRLSKKELIDFILTKTKQDDITGEIK
ncbi:MAG: cache domain-containing protein [Campylobacterota bacterium]|nr:cache domain-containing protein [Campylobacterota bacterium]